MISFYRSGGPLLPRITAEKRYTWFTLPTLDRDNSVSLVTKDFHNSEPSWYTAVLILKFKSFICSPRITY